MHITCGVCPHHLLLDMNYLDRPNGLLYKMNPPLRPESMRKDMEDMARDDFIDWFEGDHAPHTLEDKLDPVKKTYASGVPTLAFQPRFVDVLRSRGFTPERVHTMTFSNIKEAFGEKAKHLELRACTLDHTLASEYPFDAFKDVNA